MSFLVACFAGIIIYGAIRLLHLASSAAPPDLTYKEGSIFASQIIKTCSMLSEPYVPTRVWGKSGHIQTIVYGKLGRIKSPFPKGNRHYIQLDDGATMTYDVFEPISNHSRGDFTIVVSPGIANSSETSYICTFVHYAQEHGYRVAVQNHLGAIFSIELTSPRIFTYGSTQEYGKMVDELRQFYPDTQMVAVGFSMGANIVTKYLGESKDQEKKFLFAMSICQGYDIVRSFPLLLEWNHFRRLYIYFMAAYQKLLLRKHYNILLSEEIKSKYDIKDEEIFSATSLHMIDEAYTIKRWGYSNIDEYYRTNSSVNFIKNINIPMFILNARDDPLVHESLLKYPKEYAESHENCVFAITRHGGHLGYFEGGYITPNTVTWLDRVIVEFADAAVTLLETKKNLMNGALS